MKKALITGITGQDGSYLAELLLEKGYEVHGMVRRLSIGNMEQRLERINHIVDKIKLHSGTLESYSRLLELFDEIQPDECYHLAAQSFVHESFEDGFTTINQNINGTQHVLAALKRKAPQCKFYFAATSEMFGKVHEVPQKESTPFHPRSPYGISKLTGFELTRNYRESFNLFACSGILFNHESERRGYEFITRKITSTIARIKAGKANMLVIGNMEARRDWGHARDYVEAMWLMLQEKSPKDYVIATGETHSVKEFLDAACSATDIKYELLDLHHLSNEAADEIIKEKKKETDKVFVIQHPMFFRPAEVDLLIGDPSKAKKELNWEPKIKFKELVKIMVESDLRKIND